MSQFYWALHFQNRRFLFMFLDETNAVKIMMLDCNAVKMYSFKDSCIDCSFCLISFPGSLLKFCVEWNTNSRNYFPAQQVLNLVLRNFLPQDLVKLPGMQSIVEGFSVYTGRFRHLIPQRVDHDDDKNFSKT